MLDPAIGEFILTDPNMQVPSRGKIYSINEGYANNWDDAVKEYVTSRKNPPVNFKFVGHFRNQNFCYNLYVFLCRTESHTELVILDPW